MSIGDVFARAWDLWRRDVGWLILAGLVVGAIMAVVFGVAFAIFGALLAGAGLTMGSGLSSSSSSTISGFGAGIGILGVVVYMVAMFLIQVLGLTFYGGLFEMVIGAYQEKRGVVFSDLFAGFRHFSAYLVYALVLLGVSLGLGILGLLPFIGGIIALVVSIWLSVIWIYVLPLIADQEVGFMEAAGRSRQMVSRRRLVVDVRHGGPARARRAGGGHHHRGRRRRFLQGEPAVGPRRRHPAVPAARGASIRPIPSAT